MFPVFVIVSAVVGNQVIFIWADQVIFKIELLMFIANEVWLWYSLSLKLCERGDEHFLGGRGQSE